MYIFSPSIRRRVKFLLKIDSAHPTVHQQQESRWFGFQNMSADTVSDDYVTAKHGIAETTTISDSSTNSYHHTLSASQDTSSFNVSQSSNDSYETARQHSTVLSLTSNELSLSKKQDETNDSTARSIPTWIIERLRLYHKLRNIQDCPHPTRHNTCFLCRVDKLPVCYQSLPTSPASCYSNSGETHISNQIESPFRLHTYPSIR